MQLLESYSQLYVFVAEKIENCYTSRGKGGFKRSVTNSSPILSDLINSSSGLTNFFNLGMLPTEVDDICCPLSSQSQLLR